MKIKQVLFIAIIIGLYSCNKSERFQPRIANSIYDSVGLLTKEQTDSIFGLIKGLHDNIGSQMVVIIIDTLNGVKIEEYSIRQADRLRIGRDKYLDGILFTMAVRNHTMKIEVGYGLELIIKDEIASSINRNVIAPRFREGKFGLGIYKGLDSIRYLIEKNSNLVGKFSKH